MFLTKYNPATALDTIWDAFDRDFFRFFDGADEEFRLPSTNINEKEKEYVITMEMPGVSKKNVDVSLDGDSLVVTAKKVDKIESEGLIRKEIRAEKFRRSFQLGSNIDREKIKAKMENGVLKLTLPKTEGSVGRKIEIA
jgi:HSP20 family protein